MGNYKDLKIYQSAFELAIQIHHLSLNLPKFELYEQGSQIRRSSKSIKDNILEGYGRRRHKADFIKFLVYAHASCDETLNHLETIKKLYPDLNTKELLSKYDLLGRQINVYIQYVQQHWKTRTNQFNKEEVPYGINFKESTESSNSYPETCNPRLHHA